MDVDLIFKIAGVGILVSVLHTVLKQAGKEEQGHLITLVGVVIVLAMVIQVVRDLFESIKAFYE